MDDETREMLKRLLTVMEATRADVQTLAMRMDAQDGFNARQEAFNARQEAFNARQEAFNARQEAFNAKIERELADVKSEVKFQAGVINARLDEQGRILAAMIPTRLAAVPAAE
jgi:flagellar biosynthesis/type III secretory pathway protein FliH